MSRYDASKIYELCAIKHRRSLSNMKHKCLYYINNNIIKHNVYIISTIYVDVVLKHIPMVQRLTSLN